MLPCVVCHAEQPLLALALCKWVASLSVVTLRLSPDGVVWEELCRSFTKHRFTASPCIKKNLEKSSMDCSFSNSPITSLPTPTPNFLFPANKSAPVTTHSGFFQDSYLESLLSLSQPMSPPFLKLHSISVFSRRVYGLIPRELDHSKHVHCCTTNEQSEWCYFVILDISHWIVLVSMCFP